MKNVIKKISAAAMAMALLGLGTIPSQAAAPADSNLITAHAACAHNCYRYRSGNYIKCGNCDGVVDTVCKHNGYRYRVGNAVKCGKCDGVVYYS